MFRRIACLLALTVIACAGTTPDVAPEEAPGSSEGGPIPPEPGVTVARSVSAAPPAAPTPAPMRPALQVERTWKRGDSCLVPPPESETERHVCWSAPALHFGFASASIGARESAELDEVAALLRRNGWLRLRVEGHTDATGPSTYNKLLSLARAQAVRERLVARGIDGDRIEVKGWGEERPVAPNDTASQRARNRRIEIRLIE